MLFNSYEFAIFLPIVFICYWFVFNRRIKHQNFFLLIISYIFYAWWDWRFLSLIIFSSFTDFFIGQAMAKTNHPKQRQWLLIGSLIINLGLLGTFKYFDFFANSLSQSLALFNIELSPITTNLILPVGISFYTFQTLSYTIDIYKKKNYPNIRHHIILRLCQFFSTTGGWPYRKSQKFAPTI